MFCVLLLPATLFFLSLCSAPPLFLSHPPVNALSPLNHPISLGCSTIATQIWAPITLQSKQSDELRRKKMDPCPFLRILVGSLALKLPVPSSPSPLSLSSIHPSSSSSASSSPCFAKIKLSGFDLPPHHQFSIPLVSHDAGDHLIHSQYPTVVACFNLDKSQIDKLLAAPQSPSLKIEVYKGKSSSPSACKQATMASSGNKLVGKVSVPLELRRVESCAVTIQNGWVDIVMSKKSRTGKTSSSTKLYMGVRAEPDPRFVFEFDWTSRTKNQT